MPSVLVRLDDSTYRALNSVAQKRRRAEFIRSAITRAIRDAEEARTRRAYELQPDSEAEADDWSNCEEYKP
jgi:predicted transcriptional regulator